MDSIQSTYLLCLSCSSNHNCHLLRKSTSNIWLFILSYCKFIIIHAKNILIFNFRCSSTFHLATFASHTWCHYWWHYSLNIRSYQSDRFWWRGHNNVNAISNIFFKKSLSKRLIKLTCCSKHQTIIVKCQAKGLSVALCTYHHIANEPKRSVFYFISNNSIRVHNASNVQRNYTSIACTFYLLVIIIMY